MTLARWMAVAVTLTVGVCAAETITVNPDELIALAVNKARPGDVIEVMPGEYRQTLEIGVEGIKVRGLEIDGERVVLNGKIDEEAEPANGGIRIRANNVKLEGFVLRNFAKVGVGVGDCADVTVRDVIVDGGMMAGVSVERAQRVTLDRVVAGNSYDAAININESSACTVLNCEGFGSNVGVQLSSTEVVRVENSSFYGNRLGMLIGSAGGEAPAFTTVSRCRFVSNNGSAAADYTSPFKIPEGTGVLVWGATDTEISESVIADNQTLGIGVLSADEAGVRYLAKGADRSGATAERTYVHHNTYSRNGLAPSKIWQSNFPGIDAGDLYWDETGERNQFQETGELRTYPPELVVEQGGVHTNVIHFQ